MATGFQSRKKIHWTRVCCWTKVKIWCQYDEEMNELVNEKLCGLASWVTQTHGGRSTEVFRVPAMAFFLCHHSSSCAENSFVLDLGVDLQDSVSYHLFMPSRRQVLC